MPGYRQCRERVISPGRGKSKIPDKVSAVSTVISKIINIRQIRWWTPGREWMVKCLLCQLLGCFLLESESLEDGTRHLLRELSAD